MPWPHLRSWSLPPNSTVTRPSVSDSSLFFSEFFCYVFWCFLKSRSGDSLAAARVTTCTSQAWHQGKLHRVQRQLKWCHVCITKVGFRHSHHSQPVWLLQVHWYLRWISSGAWQRCESDINQINFLAQIFPPRVRFQKVSQRSTCWCQCGYKRTLWTWRRFRSTSSEQKMKFMVWLRASTNRFLSTNYDVLSRFLVQSKWCMSQGALP